MPNHLTRNVATERTKNYHKRGPGRDSVSYVGEVSCFYMLKLTESLTLFSIFYMF